jgi:hypothetical protein
MAKTRAFAGRIIFDHLAKTAGQAVNAWLRDSLGSSCVTDNTIGDHTDLITRYGGEYSVISAHVHFHGGGLDPRYQYITCFREPIDRAVSWLNFLTNNHTIKQLPELLPQAERFINSNGKESDESFVRAITNPYVEHFANIFSSRVRSDAQKLSDALLTVEEYDAWGLYEELPTFLSDTAALIGLPPPEQLKPVNVTRTRQSVTEISPALRQRLEELNTLDIEFYRILRERWQQKHSQPPVAQPNIIVSAWEPYYREAVTVATGTLWTNAILSTMSTGTEITLPIQLQSSSPEPWVSHTKLPIELSYHWLDQAGMPVIFEGVCTPLPISTITHLHTYDLQMQIIAPEAPGEYQLALLPVQGKRIWFDTRGFSPYVISVNVTELSAEQHYAGADARFRTEVGRREDGEIYSTGLEGFLLFGPYTSLPAGRYEVKVDGFQESPEVGAFVDVTWHGASKSVPFMDITHTDVDSEAISVSLVFELTEDVTDLEVRIWVNAGVCASIHSIQIRPCIAIDAIDQ